MNATAAATEFVPAAATLRPVPKGWVLAKVKTLNTHEGQALTAVVVVDGIAIGGLEEDGHGGGVWFRAFNREGKILWDNTLVEYLAHLAEANKDANGFASGEALANVLVEEAQTLKSYVRITKGGKKCLAVRSLTPTPDRDWPDLTGVQWLSLDPYTINASLTLLQQDAQARARGIEAGFTHIFDGTQWVALTV